MATKSIFKNVDIRDKTSGRLLVCALENAEKKQERAVKMSKPVKQINKDQIISIFGK